MNDHMPDILMFIGRFSTKLDGSGYSEDMVGHFLGGCCYWFAYILSVRFAVYSPVIVHDARACHFAYMIDGRAYDITGDVTEGYKWHLWDEYTGEDRDSIIQQCVMF